MLMVGGGFDLGVWFWANTKASELLGGVLVGLGLIYAWAGWVVVFVKGMAFWSFWFNFYFTDNWPTVSQGGILDFR